MIGFRHVKHLMFGLFVWAGLACAAEAAVSCTFSGVSFNPPIPARIVVPPSVPGGQVIYSTIASASYSCTGGVSGDGIIFSGPSVDGNTRAISGLTNVVTNHPAASGSIYRQGSGACFFGYSSNRAVILWSSAGTCTGSMSVAVRLYANSTGAVSGTVSPTMSTTSFPTYQGWVVAVRCTNGSSCSSFNTASGPAGSISGASVPITTLTSTCVLVTPANQFVNLPNVSQSAFTGVNSVAGSTQLPISYNCDTSGGAMSMTMEWTFQSLGGSSNILKNSGPAANVGVIIVESSTGAIVQTGFPRKQFATVADGTNTLNYYVKYIQTGSPVGTGSVSATAQFTATYQ